MHDGRNLFDPSTSTSGYDWRLDETASALISRGMMKEIIIVGIAQSPDRQSEYSDSPLGKAYMRFVVDNVKPFIDAGYRTKKGRKETAVMGSSMGAFISLMLAWKYPSVFGQIGCLSASLWVDDGKIVREIGADTAALHATRIYIDCGEKERDLLPGYRAMMTMLRRKGKVRGKDYEGRIESGASHHERYWSRRVWRPLLFMFGT
jgi:predicted alpha/beta superfamily hydrolase